MKFERRDILNTKWGLARLNKQRGYYQINSKENRHKYLHRLIWEDFYNCSIPKGYIIHHINEINWIIVFLIFSWFVMDGIAQFMLKQMSNLLKRNLMIIVVHILE